MVIELLGTSSCHLCEQVETALRVLQRAGLEFELVELDISDNDELFERYGLMIPVLRHRASGDELHWPFEGEALLRFLQRQPGR